MRDRLEAEKEEGDLLAPYASKSKDSRGRRHEEEEHPYRTIYMRDRDRIIHSSAFRRLEYKTQVFIYYEGDYYRTRLTHTMEVAQIARSMARALRLNEDLCEAIALSHDLGHPPFGHSGEKALDELMKGHDGFEHNLHTLRVIEHVENRYPGFRGLNLSWETREAVAKHSSRSEHESAADYLESKNPSLEAQVVDLADSIAYNSHDLDDGLKSGILSGEMLEEVPIWHRIHKGVIEYAGASDKLKNYQVIRHLINIQVGDGIRQTEINIKKFGVRKPDDARALDEVVVDFATDMHREQKELKAFLKESVYQNYRVVRMEEKAYRVIKDLFTAYEKRKELMEPQVQKRFGQEDRHRLICDYIAGMTDKFAIEEHAKLFDPMVRV